MYGVVIRDDHYPVSSEISDLQNFWLHAMCSCTEQYFTYCIKFAEKTDD